MIDKEYIVVISLYDTNYVTGDHAINWDSDWSLYGSGGNDFFEPRRVCNSQLEYYMQVLLF